MLPLNAALSHCDRISHDPAIVHNTLQPGRPAHGFFVRFMQSLLQAMHESRAEQAQREINRLRHLLPDSTSKKE